MINQKRFIQQFEYILQELYYLLIKYGVYINKSQHSLYINQWATEHRSC